MTTLSRSIISLFSRPLDRSPLSMAISPWVGAISTGDGLGYRWG